MGACSFESLDAIQAAFSVEPLSKQFYKDLSHWYFASLNEVEFPNDRNENEYSLKANAMIRLITRLMFVWFMKQKQLIPDDLFDKRKVDDILNWEDSTGSTYYKAILQNLFFATLNTPIGDNRKWVTTSGYGVQNFYRYKRFIENEKLFFEWMNQIPFLNGGLFENLDIVQTEDKENNIPKKDIRLDCFSDNKKNETRLKVPDYLFFGTRNADISSYLEGNNLSNVEVYGIIDILNRYDFTIDENTPDDQEVALDPELLGTVFENLQSNIDDIFNSQLNDADYVRKLFLIQNCLYGVDIQPIAMQISKLRFFISLLVEQKINRSEENFGVIPLPNLETKFVAANTLIKINRQGGQIKNLEIQDKEDELAQIRESYFSARTPKTKRKYRAKDKRLREQIADLLIGDGWADNTAHKIAQWDPFNPNAKSEWFDAEWMFGVNAFDVVIGNPPYIQLQKALPGNETMKYADVYKDENYKTFERTGDIYVLFYERSMELLIKNGVLCYITSNKWMRAKYGKPLRKYFSQKKPLQLIDLGPGIFDAATVDTNILFVRNHKTLRHNLLALTLKSKEQIHHLQEEDFTNIDEPSEESWIILSPEELTIKKKIEKIGKPLKDWDININYGIKTGYNGAFIIDEQLKYQLITEDSRSSEIIKPILRGKDIKRYKAEFAEKWLIASHNGYTRSDGKSVESIKIDEYPAVKRWLDSHWEKIKKRYDQGETPYNLRSCAYWEEFQKEKIVYNDINQKLAFSLTEAGIYFNNTVYFIAESKWNLYLLSMLNSELIDWFYKTISAQLGERAVRMFSIYVINIPIIEPSTELLKKIELLTKIVLSKKNIDEDTSAEEQQIDLMVYKLYELTYDEVLMVDPETTISEEEYRVALQLL